MPFSLAVSAKIRQILVKEIKNINHDGRLILQRNMNNPSIKMNELKNKILPEEEAKFINNCIFITKAYHLYHVH